MTSVRAIKLLLSQRRKWIGEPAMIEMRERIFNRKKVVERHKIRKMISISRTMCTVMILSDMQLKRAEEEKSNKNIPILC